MRVSILVNKMTHKADNLIYPISNNNCQKFHLFFFKGVILGGQEKIAQNVYHFLAVTGKTDIVINQWNVNANLAIMETSASMPTVPPDVIHSMATAYAQTLAGVTQVRYDSHHKSLMKLN